METTENNEQDRLSGNDMYKVPKRILYVIYCAGYTHGMNEGIMPDHGTFEAFERLMIGESPCLDGSYYTIKDKMELLP